MIIKIKLTINGDRLANWAMQLIMLLTCLPIMMTLPSILRKPLQLLAVGFFLLSLLLKRKYTYILCLAFLFSCSYLYYIGSWDEMMAGSTFLYNSLCCWIVALYGILCINGGTKSSIKLFWFVVVITLVTAMTTIIGLTQYPLAVRELGRGESYTGMDIRLLYRTHNIASWSQLYGMVFILGGFVYYFKELKNKILFIAIVVTELCILRSQITFGILLSIATVVLVIINDKSKKYYLFSFCGLILSVIFLFNLDVILECFINLSDLMEMQMLTPKLRDLYNILILGVATGDATARFDLYTMSLSSFDKFPFGLFLYRNISARNYIGYHSDLFDVIGTLGLLGLILILTGFFSYIYMLRRVSDKYKQRFVLIMFIMFCIIFILNPVFYSPQIWIGAFTLPAILISKTTSTGRFIDR